jgi:hypothetical protein
MEPTGHSGSTAMTRRKTSQFKASAALVALVALPAALAAPAAAFCGFTARKLAPGNLGLLQQYRHTASDSLRCEDSEAIGAKRTCRERRERVDLTKMTHQQHWLCTATMVLMPL